jgi:hypothetical protein
MHLMIFRKELFPEYVGDTMKKLNTCVTPTCNSDLVRGITKYRDENYFIDSKDDVFNENCLITGWEVSHFMFHVFIGYFYNIYVHLGISVGYEVYERIQHNAGSYNDVIYNFLGFLAGKYLKGLV